MRLEQFVQCTQLCWVIFLGSGDKRQHPRRDSDTTLHDSPELSDTDNNGLAALQRVFRHFCRVAGRVDAEGVVGGSALSRAREDGEGEEEGEEKDAHQGVAVLQDGVDVVLRPCGVGHDEGCLAEGHGVVVHEDSVVSEG